MRRSVLLLALVSLVLFAAGCQQAERSVTGEFGTSRVTGHVVMTGDSAGSSPAGIEVRVAGTGVAAVTDAQGRFDFVSMPEGDNELTFRRASDGISARVVVPSSAEVVVELSKSGAHLSPHRRGVGHPGEEIEGVIKTASATSITVTSSHQQDVDIAITDTTIVRKGQTTVAAADLKAGDRVHVKATINGDGDRTAVEIIVQTGSEPEVSNSFEGTVVSVGTDSLVVKKSDGTEVTVNVGASTLIRRQGQIIAIDQIKPGDVVAVKALTQNDGSLMAIRINVEVPDDAEVEFSGEVVSVGTDSLVVKKSDGTEVTVTVDASTVIRSGHDILTLPAVQVGAKVEVSGVAMGDGSVRARRINVEVEQMEIQGTIASVGTDSIVVTTSSGDVTVKVDSSTRIRKRSSMLQLSDLQAGQAVEVQGTKIDATTLLARSIQVEGD